MRRSRGLLGPAREVLHVGPLTLDRAGRRAALNGQELSLTQQEFSLLCALAERAGRVLSREQLLELANGGVEGPVDRATQLTGTCRIGRNLSMAKLTAAGEVFTELVLEVFRVNGLTLEAGDALTESLGLSSARWQVLGVVDHEPAPVANVARLMGLARQSVQQTADALERDGFIEYQDNPHHRRAKLIAMTARGREALRKVEARQAVWANQLAAGMETRALKELVDGLRQVRQRLEEDAASGVRTGGAR